MENIGEIFYQLTKICYNGNAISCGDQTLIYSLSSHKLHQAYARVRENPARENHLVVQMIAVIAINASDAADIENIIMVGHLMDLVSIRKEIDLVGEFYNREFTVPDNPGFGTAMGVLLVLKE